MARERLRRFDLRQCRAVIGSLLYLLLGRVLRVFWSDERSGRGGARDRRPPTPDRGPPPAGEAADLPNIRQGVPRGREQDVYAGSVGCVPGSARDALALAPTARRQEVDQAAPPSGTPRSRPRGPKADRATWEIEPQVGLHADSGRAAQARGEGFGHHDRAARSAQAAQQRRPSPPASCRSLAARSRGRSAPGERRHRPHRAPRRCCKHPVKASKMAASPRAVWGLKDGSMNAFAAFTRRIAVGLPSRSVSISSRMASKSRSHVRPS